MEAGVSDKIYLIEIEKKDLNKINRGLEAHLIDMQLGCYTNAYLYLHKGNENKIHYKESNIYISLEKKVFDNLNPEKPYDIKLNDKTLSIIYNNGGQ